MSQAEVSIQKLLELLDMVPQESDMLVRLLKEEGSDIRSLSTFILSTLSMQQKLRREQQVRQQVRDLVSASRQGEV